MKASPHLSRFTLERWLTGELAEADVEEIDSHLATCAVCKARATTLRADQEAFAEELPYASFCVEHQRRLAQRREIDGRRWWLLLPAVAAAAAGLLVVALPDRPIDPTERIKGSGLGLSLFDDTGEPLFSGQMLLPGSRIQPTYDAGPYRFLALIGIDATGEVATYCPEHGNRLAPLPAGARGRFPFGLELDDTRGVERFFLVLAEQPESLAVVLDAARTIAHTDLQQVERLPLPPGFAQATVWVRKQEGHRHL